MHEVLDSLLFSDNRCIGAQRHYWGWKFNAGRKVQSSHVHRILGPEFDLGPVNKRSGDSVLSNEKSVVAY